MSGGWQRLTRHDCDVPEVNPETSVDLDLRWKCWECGSTWEALPNRDRLYIAEDFRSNLDVWEDVK